MGEILFKSKSFGPTRAGQTLAEARTYQEVKYLFGKSFFFFLSDKSLKGLKSAVYPLGMIKLTGNEGN